MITLTIFWVIAAVFGLKILGNLALAYGTLAQKEDEGSSIMIVLLMDAVLLVLITTLGWLLGEGKFPYGGKSVFIWSSSIIAFSYTHFFIVMVIGSKFKK